MKKTSILIAVFVVVAAASSAIAQSKLINFDGQASNTHGPALSASMIEQNPGYDIPLPQEPDMEPTLGQLPPCSELSVLSWLLPCNNMPQFPPDCNQTQSDTWWWIAVCGNQTPIFPNPVYLDAPAAIKNKSHATETAKNNLTQLLLGYCNTYPEFASSIMPILKGKNVSVIYDSKGAYIMNDKTVVRLDFTKLSLMTPAISAVSQNKIAPALEVGLLVAENIAAWYSVYQTWNNYHSSDNSTDSGSDGGNNGGYVQPNTHQSDYNIQHNLQRIRTAH